MLVILQILVTLKIFPEFSKKDATNQIKKSIPKTFFLFLNKINIRRVIQFGGVESQDSKNIKIKQKMCISW